MISDAQAAIKRLTWLWVLLGILGFVLIVTSVYCCINNKNKKEKKEMIRDAGKT
jgi:hypothetical protein